MNFSESMSKIDFAQTIGEVLLVTREAWHDSAHIAMMKVGEHRPDVFICPHNIDNYMVKYNPSVDDVCADDWNIYSERPKIII